MRTFNTVGIVLRRNDYMENDRLFIIYTKDYGKIEVVAKGTKRILSKLNPHLEPITHLKMMVAKGRGFDKLANAVTIDAFDDLKFSGNLHLNTLIGYAMEATDKMTYPLYRDQQVYDNLLAWLQFMEGEKAHTLTNDQLYYYSNAYVLRLLSSLGFKPELKRCIECSKGLLFPKLTYDFIKGGVICEKCKQISLISEFYDISDSVIKILDITLNESYATLANYNFTSADLKDFNNIVYKLALYQLHKPLQSLSMLKFLN